LLQHLVTYESYRFELLVYKCVLSFFDMQKIQHISVKKHEL